MQYLYDNYGSYLFGFYGVLWALTFFVWSLSFSLYAGGYILTNSFKRSLAISSVFYLMGFSLIFWWPFHFGLFCLYTGCSLVGILIAFVHLIDIVDSKPDIPFLVKHFNKEIEIFFVSIPVLATLTVFFL